MDDLFGYPVKRPDKRSSHTEIEFGDFSRWVMYTIKEGGALMKEGNKSRNEFEWVYTKDGLVFRFKNDITPLACVSYTEEVIERVGSQQRTPIFDGWEVATVVDDFVHLIPSSQPVFGHRIKFATQDEAMIYAEQIIKSFSELVLDTWGN
jgi:hypothetical protein